uniref:Uncharacterized protein n=1 Tax=Acrobeloides nanus TaxID=290746 RepID=A0A914DPQ6_9BILA
MVSYHHVASGIYQLNIFVPENEADLIYRFNVEHFTMYDIYDEEQIEILKKMKDFQSVKELMSRRTEVYLPDNTV